MSAPGRPPDLDISAGARRLQAASVVADAHNDLLMTCVRQPAGRQAEYFRSVWLPQLRLGGVDIQVLPVFIEDEFRPEGALRQTLRMLEAAWRIAERCPEVDICLTGDDIDAALGRGSIALVLALEGCEAVGTDLGLFETLYRLGVRMASFTHFGRTMLADGSAEDGSGGRLTAAGIDAVRLCQRIGVMLDVSHLGAASTDHLLELAERPMVASHSSSYAQRPHHRNLTDARMRTIAAAGGVVGVNFLATFVDESEHTVARVVDHVEHAVGVMGVEHVGLGPDFIARVSGALARTGDPDWPCEGNQRQYVPGLEGPAGLPLVTETMLRRGWSEPDIQRVIGGNFHSLFRRELGVPAAARVTAPSAPSIE